VRVDVSLQEAVTHMSIPRVAGFLRDGVEPEPETLANFAPGTGLFETADRAWVALAAVEDHFWERMCSALGLPALAKPPYDTHRGRMARRTELRIAIAGRVGELTLAELTGRLEDCDVPMDRVRGIADVCADPHLRSRGMVRTGMDGGMVVDFPVLIDGRRSAASDLSTDLSRQ
jgi:crotonobetainyl-CoA:carnitine CoA-transferase CaiB-like acyl-CoA transferase